MALYGICWCIFSSKNLRDPTKLRTPIQMKTMVKFFTHYVLSAAFIAFIARLTTNLTDTMKISSTPGITLTQANNLSNKDEEKGEEEVNTGKPQTNYLETLTHLIRGVIGAGIFAMGDAFKNSGLVLGVILTVALGVITTHCLHILLTCSEEFQKRTKATKPLDFAATVEMCILGGPNWMVPWAKTSRKLINIFVCVMQLGFCAVYFVFISSNVAEIFKLYDIHIEIHFLMAMVLIPIILEVLIRNLKHLAPISTVANFLMVVGLGITYYYACQDWAPISERRLFGEIETLPLFFGTVIYAFVVIGLVIPLKSAMKSPESFQKPAGVLNVGVTIVTLLLGSAGFLGYRKWGDDVKGSMTLNLPSGTVTVVLQGILSVAILFTLPIQFYVPVEIIWPQINKKYGPFKNPVISELTLRIVLVLLTFTMAEAIPHLNIFISFVGATCGMTLALIIPPIMDIVFRMQKDEEEIEWYCVFKNVCIFVLGVIGLVTGLYETIRAIIHIM